MVSSPIDGQARACVTASIARKTSTIFQDSIFPAPAIRKIRRKGNTLSGISSAYLSCGGCGTELLRTFAAGPGRDNSRAALPVCQQGRRQLADGLHVQQAQRAASGVGDVARIGIDFLYLSVPQPPQLK